MTGAQGGRHLLALGIAAALATLLTWPLLEGPAPGNFIALKARDALFTLRQFVGHPPPLSPRIVVVAIDERTLRAPALRKPMAQWGGEHARVLRALTNAGASAVVVDVIQPFPEDQDRELALAIREAPVALAVDLDDATGALAPPNPILLTVAGQREEVAGLVRLSQDGDGALRRASFVHGYQEGNVLTLWFQGTRRFLGLSLPEFAAAWQGKEGGLLPLPTGSVPLVPAAAGQPPECMVINFAGPDGTVERISYLEVLEHSPEPAWLQAHFRGRLVFLGVTAPDMQDYHLTPMSWAQAWQDANTSYQPLPGVLPGRRPTEANREMAGVEILAQAANAMVVGAYLRWPGGLLAWSWTLGLCLLAALAGHSRRGRFLWLAIHILGTLTVGFWLFDRQGLLMPLSWPLGGSLLAFTAGTAWRYRATDRERWRIRALLSRYVSDPVADLLVEHPGEAALEGRTAEVTLLFCDLNNFTTWTEKTDPTRAITLLNEYFSAMEDIIFRKGGTLKQFVGDEIMVIFGAPFAQADAEERAVLTALLMQQELGRLGEAWEKRGFPRLTAKFGIHRGRVVLGNVGSARRSEYAAVGDAVNLASRIMGLTKTLGHMLLISEDVYLRVRNLVRVTEFAPQQVKGREMPVKVYGLDGLQAAAPTADGLPQMLPG